MQKNSAYTLLWLRIGETLRVKDKVFDCRSLQGEREPVKPLSVLGLLVGSTGETINGRGFAKLL